MIIYEFSTWGTKRGELFSVKEFKVEEKPKTFVGENCHIKKSDIGILSPHYGNRMYLLENKPEIYINAMIDRCKCRVNAAETRLAGEREDLDKWWKLAEGEK